MNTVAVVLCNYNHARYLPDSLGHICSQTRPADQILVIDDGSTDDSWDIIQGFARDHSNLHARANGRNLGLEASIAKVLGSDTATDITQDGYYDVAFDPTQLITPWDEPPA